MIVNPIKYQEVLGQGIDDALSSVEDLQLRLGNNSLTEEQQKIVRRITSVLKVELRSYRMEVEIKNEFIERLVEEANQILQEQKIS